VGRDGAAGRDEREAGERGDSLSQEEDYVLEKTD